MGSASLQGGLIGGIEKRDIIIVNYDPTWPAKFEMHRGIITKTLGDAALQIEHIGSTSVPGLAAKPIVDILVVVSDSADESRYLPQLTAAGMCSGCVSRTGTSTACSGPLKRMCTSTSTRLVAEKVTAI